MIDPLVDCSGAPTAYGNASRNCRGSAFTQPGGASTKVTTSAEAVWSMTSVVLADPARTLRLAMVSGSVVTGRRSGTKSGTRHAAVASTPTRQTRVSIQRLIRAKAPLRRARTAAAPISTSAGTQNTNPYGMNDASRAGPSSAGGTTRSTVATRAGTRASSPRVTSQP